jgi:hypothetical protein
MTTGSFGDLHSNSDGTAPRHFETIWRLAAGRRLTPDLRSDHDDALHRATMDRLIL